MAEPVGQVEQPPGLLSHPACHYELTSDSELLQFSQRKSVTCHQCFSLLLNVDSCEFVFFVVLDALSKINSSNPASASPPTATPAAAHSKPVPAAAPAAPAAPAASAPPLPSARNACTTPDGGAQGDDDPSTRDPTAAQEHPHKPPLQRSGGDACARYVSPLLLLWPKRCHAPICKDNLAS